MNEHRRAPRRQVGNQVDVLDVMTDSVIGRVGNLSQSGMLLLANRPLVDDALYQIRFELHDSQGAGRHLDIGAHMLWGDDASAPGQHWIGLRFIDVSSRDADFLRLWAEAPGSHHV